MFANFAAARTIDPRRSKSAGQSLSDPRRSKSDHTASFSKERFDEGIDWCHWFQKLSGLGVSVLDSPGDPAWGRGTLYFADPEHTVLEIYADI